MKIVDISRGLLAAPLYPESASPLVWSVAQRALGDAYNETVVQASVHTATHADAPCHFTDSTQSIDQMPLEHYFGQCYVLTVQDPVISLDFLAAHLPKGCQRLLLHGGGACYCMAEMGAFLQEWGVLTLGTDAWSVGSLDDEAAVHGGLLTRGIAILENLWLDQVTDGWYFLSAAPIKIEGSDGAFVRAVLLG